MSDIKGERIVVVFAGTDAVEAHSLASRVDVRQLLRDALGEFIAARSPAEGYVQKRYGFEPGGVSHADKVHEVAIRTRFARLLKRGEVFHMPELRRQAPEPCTLYKLVLSEIVQLQAMSGKDDVRARGERRRLWGRVGYDVHVQFVVAARNESEARKLACECERDTRRAPGTAGPLSDELSEDVARRWLDPTRSVCEAIGIAAGEDAEHEHIVSGSFRNG